MIYLITLLANGSSSIPQEHYIEADSKEAAFNSLVLERGINPTHYSTILVCDLSLHIHKSKIKDNRLNVKINNDFSKPLLDLVVDYNKSYFKTLSHMSYFDLHKLTIGL